MPGRPILLIESSFVVIIIGRDLHGLFNYFLAYGRVLYLIWSMLTSLHSYLSRVFPGDIP